MPKGVYERGAYKGKYKPGTQHDTPAGPITVLSVDAATCGRGQATRLVIRFNRTGAVREVQANNLSQGKVYPDRIQPRALVGCLLAVGEGRRPVAWAGEILRAVGGAGSPQDVKAQRESGTNLTKEPPASQRVDPMKVLDKK